jgi:hypothetical protein
MNKKRISVILDEKNPNTFVVCKECGKKFTQITHTHVKHHNLTVDSYIQKYNLKKDDVYCYDICSIRKVTLENMINRWGDVEGKQKWEAYKNKQSITNTFEYKQEKFGWTREDFDKYNTSRAVTLENMINRYGVVNGKIKWDSYCKTQEKAGCAKEYFIEKYGEEDGIKKYEEIGRLKVVSKDNFIRKYGEKIGAEKWDNYLIKMCTRKQQSKMANELFFSVLSTMNDEKKEHIFFEGKNHEYFFSSKGYKTIFVDFYDISQKKIIEFAGDYWHGNPTKYNPEFYNAKAKMTAKELYENTLQRNEILKNVYNCKVLTIWENDFLNDKEKTINQCISFLNETI